MAPSREPDAALRFQRPRYPDARAIERYFSMAREASWYSNDGPCLKLFRERLDARAGAHSAPLANATLALLLGVTALRRGGGDRVLLPSFTFPAVVQAVLWNGMTPVFVDISPGHLHLDPDRLDEALESEGRAVGMVIAGCSFGTPPPPPVRRRWEEACERAGVPLLV